MTYPVINAAVATANINSNSFDIGGLPIRCANLGVQVIATGLNSADATVKIQHAMIDLDAAYQDITDATLTIASGTSYPVLSPITNIGSTYYRAVYTKNTNSAGTVTVIFSFN